MPLANSLIGPDGSMYFISVPALSSYTTTSVVVVICIPIYQFVFRPLLGERSPRHLWRIFAGLALQLVSLVVVLVSSASTTSKFGSEEVANACNFFTDMDVQIDEVEEVNLPIFVIPQVVNGISQLLVFPAVIDLILTDTPRVMQGLLIGIWYAMHSIHVIVGIVETATCVVFYWQYYIVKIVLVLVSIITFAIISSFYKRSHPVHDRWRTPTDGDVP